MHVLTYTPIHQHIRIRADMQGGQGSRTTVSRDQVARPKDLKKRANMNDPGYDSIVIS